MVPSIGDVLQYLKVEAEPWDQDNVDALVEGDPSVEVTGIATVFMASQEAIEQAAALGVNLLITHESLLYSHRPSKKLIVNDPVIMQKRETMDRSGIAICRYHDGIHRESPDGITAGLVAELGWEDYVQEYQLASATLEIPAMPLKEVAKFLKDKLGLPFVRWVGDPDIACARIGLLVGYRGGSDLALPLFAEQELDLIVAGEGPEWETPEYVRDAVHQGRSRALVLLGHGPSEAPGMKHLARRLQTAFPDVPVHFIENHPLFQIMG